MTLAGAIALWWVWFCAALLFGILEVVIPAFIFLGFAIGAALVGGLLWLGLLPIGPNAILVVFAGLSLVAYLILQRVMGLGKDQVKVITRDVNDN